MPRNRSPILFWGAPSPVSERSTPVGIARMSYRGPLLQLVEVSKCYRRGPENMAAADRINLEIEPGELVALMGPSGSGKSPILQHAEKQPDPAIAGAVGLRARRIDMVGEPSGRRRIETATLGISRLGIAVFATMAATGMALCWLAQHGGALRIPGRPRSSPRVTVS